MKEGVGVQCSANSLTHSLTHALTHSLLLALCSQFSALSAQPITFQKERTLRLVSSRLVAQSVTQSLTHSVNRSTVPPTPPYPIQLLCEWVSWLDLTDSECVSA